MITDLQLRVLRAVDEHITKHGNGPKLGAIHRAMGSPVDRHPTAWSSCLRLLRKAGCITWDGGDYETLELTKKGKLALRGETAPDSDDEEGAASEDAPPSSRDEEEFDTLSFVRDPDSEPVKPARVAKPIEAKRQRRKRCDKCRELLDLDGSHDGDCAFVPPAAPTVMSVRGHDLVPSRQTLLTSEIPPPYAPVHVPSAVSPSAGIALRALDELEASKVAELEALRTTKRLLGGAR